MDDDGAIIVGDYRYLLWRNWVPNNQRRLLWIMLNPSTANECTNDPTIQRCIDFSKRKNYGGLEIVNLFAYRNHDPKTLSSTRYPVGDENDDYVEKAIERATDIVVAWGAWGANGMYRQRAQDVLARLSKHQGKRVLCLGMTQDGCPRHPSRLATGTSMRPYG